MTGRALAGKADPSRITAETSTGRSGSKKFQGVETLSEMLVMRGARSAIQAISSRCESLVG